MKGIVLYRSKTGFVKQYATLISTALNIDKVDVKDVSTIKLDNFDYIIFGGSLYASTVTGLKQFMKLIDIEGSDKKLIIFLTGASTGKREEIDVVLDKNFTKSQRAKIKTFYLRGGFNYNKLNCFDKFLMNIMKFMLKRKKNPTSDEKGMLTAFDKPMNFVSKKNIQPLISFVKNLEN